MINHQQPAGKTHRVAAKQTADELRNTGDRLQAIAIGDPVTKGNRGFNWRLSRQAFKIKADQANDLIKRVSRPTEAVRQLAISRRQPNNNY